MKKRLVLIRCLVCILLCGVLYGENPVTVGLELSPAASLPSGGEGENYLTGYGAQFAGLVGFQERRFFTPLIDAAYLFVPLNLGQSGLSADANLTLLRGGLGARLAKGMNERLSVSVQGFLSAYTAALVGDTGGSAGGLAYGGDAGAALQLNPAVSMGVRVGYGVYRELYQGVTFSLGTTVRVAGAGNAAIPRIDFSPSGQGSVEGYIEFLTADIDRVYPVLYKYYDDHPLGSATVVNRSSRSVRDLEVRLQLKQFMDAPKLSARIEELAPGEERQVDLYALFTEEILSVTEGAKVAAELQAEYSVGGRKGSDGSVVTLNTHNRNALTWDDDRKIAAFVTARDEEVQRFARNTASIVDDQGNSALPRELQLAMVFLNAMQEHRCAYVVDPNSSYFEMSRNGEVVDTVQFPRQTLQYRAGDCDDLSATYAALLESAGIATAFITVPGHIYTAFKLPLTAREARRTFQRSDDLIYRDDGAVWLPVETTLLREGFLAAWAEGASQWRTHAAADAAELIPTAEAWRTYEPVAFGVSDYEVDIPPRSDVSASFSAELSSFVKQEISSREEELLARIRRQPGNPGTRNRLGVLYARYGFYAEAQAQFREAVQGREYLPALINLGNISFLQGSHRRAREAYARALERDPENPAALLGLAKVDYADEEFAAAQESYARLAEREPELAERFAYLSGGGETGRAADALSRSTMMIWEEEE